MNQTPRPEKVLLIGYGDIAQRLAKRLPSEDYQAVGLCRTPRKSSIPILQGDASKAQDMADALKQSFDIIVITLTPSEMSDSGYQQAYVTPCKHLVSSLQTLAQKPRLIIFVSSTSVYGQKQGDWVDESSATEPSSYSGKRLLEAESLLQTSGLNTCVVRFSGIYGPGRNRLIEQVKNRQGSPAEPPLYSNRIHSDDCAGVLAHLIEQSKTQTLEALYLATDDEPAPLDQVKSWIADTLGIPPGDLQTPSPSGSFRGSKRCRNQRILETGYSLMYPTFREGYGELLNKEGSH